MGYFSKTAIAVRGDVLVSVMERSFCSDTIVNKGISSWGMAAYAPPKEIFGRAKKNNTRVIYEDAHPGFR